MNDAVNPYQSWGTIAARADADERAGFIRQTYAHLGGAVLAFAGLEWVLLNSSLAEPLNRAMLGTRYGWLAVMAGFMAVSWIADRWARSSTSVGMQYLGLSLYVAAEAVIFMPLLTIANKYGGDTVIPTAGILTVLIFGGLTGIVFFTGADFSYLRTGLCIAGFAAMGLIVCSIMFGFQLGMLFSAAMVVLSAGYILYDTSQVMHQYRIGQHVAAALALFASVALMFWYLVQLVMSLQSRD